MVYESDFYTTRRPYRNTPSITTYSVSNPRYYTVRDAPDSSRRAAEQQYTYSYQSTTESRSGDPYSRPTTRSYTNTERTTLPSRQVRILPGLGKVHVVHTYDRIVPYVGHKRLTVVTSNPMVYRVRPSILNREFDRIEHKYRPATYLSALSEYMNSQPAVRYYVRYPYSSYSNIPSYYYTIYRPYYSTYYTNRYLIRRPYYNYDTLYYPHYPYYYDYDYSFLRPRYVTSSSKYILRRPISDPLYYPYYYYNYYPLYRPRYSSLFSLSSYLSSVYDYYYKYYPFYNPKYWNLYAKLVYVRNPNLDYYPVQLPVPYVAPRTPRFARTFDDETRVIRAETASLLKRIHSPVPRTPRALPLPYISRYDEYPTNTVSDKYIYRMLVSSKKDPRVIAYTTYYTEPVRKYFGQGHMSCISFAGDKVHPRRRNVYVYEDPVRNDIQLLSYYIAKFRQEKPAVSIKELPSATILPAARPTRIFTSTREERAKARAAAAAVTKDADLYRPLRSPADEEAIKRAQQKQEEEARLAAQKAEAEEAARQEAEAKKLEAARLAEIARQEELAAKAAAEKAAELERQAELARQEELAKQAEIERARKAEEERARLEEEKRLAELAKAEEERQQLLRLEEIARQAEAEREAELARQAEELAELARQEAELAELKKKEEEEARKRQEEEEAAELARQEAELAELERQEKELAELARQEAELAEQAKLEAEQARKEADDAAQEVAQEEESAAPVDEPEAVAEEEAPVDEPVTEEAPAEQTESAVVDEPAVEPEPVVEEPETPEAAPEEETAPAEEE